MMLQPQEAHVIMKWNCNISTEDRFPEAYEVPGRAVRLYFGSVQSSVLVIAIWFT
jgi:hypothetical protein